MLTIPLFYTKIACDILLQEDLSFEFVKSEVY